jgi:gamma-glutamylputrescine oxidase
MVWDTDLTYGYFRPTPDGRLLIGGGLLQNTYSANVDESPRVIDHLRQYVDANLPALRGTKFTNWWPGFIGVTKDLLPVAGQSPDTPSHYFAICGAGLPWATLAGRVAAGVALGYNPPLADQFRPGRSFTDLDPLQNILGKPVTFALSHYYAKEYLRGGPRAVRRRKALVAGLIAAAAGALSWAFCCAALHGARRWRSDQRA